MPRLSSKKLQLSPEQQELLRNAVITRNGPGTILHDFDSLMSFVRGRDFPITGTHLLPLHALAEINAGMSHPLQQGLKRPQQKSFPRINGLYLLLRASGLTIIGGTSKKPLLLIDEQVYQAWSNLSPTEQYFTLLETWLLRGDPGIIGEDRSRYIVPDHCDECMNLFEKIPKKGLQIADNSDVESLIKYAPGWYNLGLMEMFGLITIQHGLPIDGKAWNIERIYRTQFGEALLVLLVTKFFRHMENIFELEDQGGWDFGVLQPILRPYFPQWKNNLSLPEWPFRDGTYIFRVSVDRVWFRIAIPASQTLDAFASAILKAVRFSDDHLHLYSYKNRFGCRVTINHPYMEEGPWTSEVRVGDIPLLVGQTMTFLFDFGDSWEFDVNLEQIDVNKTGEAVLLEIHGKAPEQYPRWDDED
jgi:hypothetical protein